MYTYAGGVMSAVAGTGSLHSCGETGYIYGVNHQAVEEVWLYSGAAGNELLVLMSIARYLNAERTAEPSHASVERLTGLSERTITRCLRRSEDAKRLKIKYRKNNCETNLYTLPRYVPTAKMAKSLDDGQPTVKMADKLPFMSVQDKRGKKDKPKRTERQGSSTVTMTVGREHVISLPGDVTTDARTLALSFQIADAMIEHRGKSPRYRSDAESFEWIDGTEKLVLAMTPGERLQAERYLGYVLEHVVISDEWRHVKMPPDLHAFWKPIRQSMSDRGRPPEKIDADDWIAQKEMELAGEPD
jgi:hypothetical protein